MVAGDHALQLMIADKRRRGTSKRGNGINGTFFEPYVVFPFVFKGGVSYDCSEDTDRSVSVKPDNMADNKVCSLCW